MDGLKGRRLRGKPFTKRDGGIVEPRMERLKMARLTPAAMGSFAKEKPISPAENISSYKRRRFRKMARG